MGLITALTEDQHRVLDNIHAAAARIWARPLHRYFTDHGPNHTDRIIALLDGLTTGMLATDKRLTPTEVFVLLAATCLHDIGMQDERYAGGDLEKIRAIHHLLTAELIFEAEENPAQVVKLGLPDDPGLIEAIALVAKGHRQEDLQSDEYHTLPVGGATLRLRLLAALLRFADELDIDYRRVDLEQMKLLALPVDSQLHWWKCHYVAGVSIVDEYIRVAYRFPQSRPDYEALLIPLIEGEIRAKHAALEPIFRAHAVKVAIGKPEVRLLRLVKPMPAEVEVLAKSDAPPAKPTSSRRKATLVAAKPAAESEKQPRRHREVPPKPLPGTVFDQQGQKVGTQINVAGDYHHTVASGERSVAIDGNASANTFNMGDTHTRQTPVNVSAEDAIEVAPLRARLQRLDTVELESLCLDHFPTVYDKFDRGLRRDEKTNLLLNYIRYHPDEATRLVEILKQMRFT